MAGNLASHGRLPITSALRPTVISKFPSSWRKASRELQSSRLPSSLFHQTMEGERGGVYPQRWPLEECGDGDLGLGVHSLRMLPVEKGERTTIKMAA